MANYIINIENGTDLGTIVPDVQFSYTKKLNSLNEASLAISGSTAVRRTLFKVGAKLYIYKDGTLDFLGVIDKKDNFVGGTIKIHASGYEIYLSKEEGTFSNSPYTSTASATIFSELIAESSYFTAGTIDTGYDIDFRANSGDNLWNPITNLALKTNQDIEIDYSALTIGINDHVGSTTSVATLNQGKEITNVQSTTLLPIANKVTVYGKGDGTYKVKGTKTDATSVGTYGTISKRVDDSTCMSTSECERLAQTYLDMWKDPEEIYDFDLTNPNYSGLSLGDVVYINAPDADLSNQEVRIVGIIRGEKSGREFVSLQVTNPSFKTLMRKQSDVIAQIKKEQLNKNTYMQGNGNTLTWGSGKNAKNGASMKVVFNVPSLVNDIAGNMRISSMTLDYDVDPYNSQFGTASFDGSDPQVQNSSGNTEPDVENSSGSTTPAVSGSSGSTSPGVSGSSGNEDPYLDKGTSSLAWSGSTLGTDSNTSVSCASGTWTELAKIETDGSDDALYANFTIEGNTGGPEDIQFRLDNTGVLSSTNSVWADYCDGFRDDAVINIRGISAGPDGSSDFIILEAYPHTGAITLDASLTVYKASHSHSYGNYGAENHAHTDGTFSADNHSHDDGTYAAANHDHTSGTYNAANHDHPDGTYDINAADLDYISISDDISEAASINSTEVNIYLDYWNGSSWINKHSILSTGKTIDTDVDITNSGTYPDAIGFWRVRIEPNSSSADFVQGIVKIKHNLDN